MAIRLQNNHFISRSGVKYSKIKKTLRKKVGNFASVDQRLKNDCSFSNNFTLFKLLLGFFGRYRNKPYQSLTTGFIINGAKMLDFVKDAAGIAMEAINYARDSKIDVVLVDTAGRMQVRGYFTPQKSIIVLFLILRLS
jgi:hypothetical protein